MSKISSESLEGIVKAIKEGCSVFKKKDLSPEKIETFFPELSKNGVHFLRVDDKNTSIKEFVGFFSGHSIDILNDDSLGLIFIRLIKT